MTHAQLTKEIDKMASQLWSLRRRVILSMPTNRQANVLRQTGGALKHRIKGDVVAWQKKIRREWGR